MVTEREVGRGKGPLCLICVGTRSPRLVRSFATSESGVPAVVDGVVVTLVVP